LPEPHSSSSFHTTPSVESTSDLVRFAFVSVVSNLGENTSSTEDASMQRALMAPMHFQTIEDLCVAIDSFVSRSSTILSTEIGEVHGNVLVAAANVSPVCSIALNHFTRSKSAFQPLSKCLEIGPCSTSKWPVDPDNVTSLNANTNFAP